MIITDNNISMASYTQKVNTSKTVSGSFSEIMNKSLNETSVVDEHKKKHPEEASIVDGQVKAGEQARKRYGSDVSTKDMSMSEYKRYITGILNQIPFDSTRIYDEEIISISEKGWEQMKNDPKYEAWILGYTVRNRSVSNPFAVMGAANFCVERFGASIEEHRGESVSKSASKSSSSEEESWWAKRHRKIAELLVSSYNTASLL